MLWLLFFFGIYFNGRKIFTGFLHIRVVIMCELRYCHCGKHYTALYFRLYARYLYTVKLVFL